MRSLVAEASLRVTRHIARSANALYFTPLQM